MVTSKNGSLKLNIPERAIKQGELIKLHIATDLALWSLLNFQGVRLI